MSDTGMRKKVTSKAAINQPVSLGDMDVFGDRLKIPPHIRKELQEADLVPRFVNATKVQAAGGNHHMGWTVYTVKNPQVNPLTGQADNVYRVGDLVLATKPRAQYERHKAYLQQRSSQQSQSHKNSVKEMRDRIKDSRADKHVSLIEGYDENGDDNE